MEEIKRRDRKAVNRIFHLHYIDGRRYRHSHQADALTDRTGCPDAGGHLRFSDAQTDTDGDSYSTDDTLVVNDFPDNISGY